MHITGENTTNSYAYVFLAVFYAYIWWKHNK